MENSKKFLISSLFALVLASCDLQIPSASSVFPSSESALSVSVSESISTDLPSSEESISSQVSSYSESASSAESISSEEPISSQISPYSESASSVESISSEEPSSSSSFSSSLSSVSSSSSAKSSSSSQSSSSSVYVQPATYDFYCVNDFHGSVVEQLNGRNYEAGIKKVFGYLEAKKAEDPEHTIVISAGDMFQGSLESNINYGALVTEAMNAVPFDAMVLGNHEFDYGIEHLLDRRDQARFPMLCGNAAMFGKTNEYWNAFRGSTIVEKGGHKIGIVGMIGEGQTTSITSSHVSELVFEHPQVRSIALSQELRNQGCDIVVLTVHDDSDSLFTWSGYNNMKQYFDGIFCGHSHTKNYVTVGGVPALQAYCNGQGYSHFKLSIASDGQVTCKTKDVTKFTSATEESTKISQICDKYLSNEEYQEKSVGVAGTLNTALDRTTVANLGSRAIYEKYSALHPGLICAIQNSQRANVASGTVYYRDLYKAMPFMNRIVIAQVIGSDLRNEANQNCTYVGEAYRNLDVDDDKTYLVAVIDYLFYHQDGNKRFNYFRGLNSGKTYMVAEYEDYPADIAYYYCKDNLGGTINGNLYSSKSSNGFGIEF